MVLAQLLIIATTVIVIAYTAKIILETPSFFGKVILIISCSVIVNMFTQIIIEMHP